MNGDLLGGHRLTATASVCLRSLLCETKVYSNSAIGIRGFQSFPAVRQKNCGGGLYIGSRHGLCESVMTDSGKNAEFITVRLNCWDRGLRVICVYGPLGV